MPLPKAPSFLALLATLPPLLLGCTNWELGPGEYAGPAPTNPESAPAESERASRVVAQSPPSANRSYRASDVYVFIACASSSNRAERWSEPTLVKKGLAAIVDEQVLPRYRQGYRRFYVDSPFGKETDTKGNPQFGFFGAMRVGIESPWRKRFVDAWQQATRLSGVKIVAYLGNPYADAEFKSRLAGPDGRARALEMMRQAIAPVLAAGFQGIGIDASSSTDEDSPLGDLMKDLQSKGVEIYIEGTPASKQRWLTRFGTIRTTWFARNAPTDHSVVAVSECQGEKIQLFDGTVPFKELDKRPWEEWGRRWVRTCLDGGEYPAVGLASFPGDAKRDLGVE